MYNKIHGTSPNLKHNSIKVKKDVSTSKNLQKNINNSRNIKKDEQYSLLGIIFSVMDKKTLGFENP